MLYLDAIEPIDRETDRPKEMREIVSRDLGDTKREKKKQILIVIFFQN